MPENMVEITHQLVQREPDGEIYCRRCGLQNPSDEEQLCIPVGHSPAQDRKKAA